MAPPPGGEITARLRMIAAYGDLQVKDIAAVLNVSARQVSRLTSGEVAPTVEQLEELALTVGVPTWLARYGLNPPPAVAGEEVLRRLDALERRAERSDPD